jgi:hypothetical protein
MFETWDGLGATVYVDPNAPKAKKTARRLRKWGFNVEMGQTSSDEVEAPVDDTAGGEGIGAFIESLPPWAIPVAIIAGAFLLLRK